MFALFYGIRNEDIYVNPDNVTFLAAADQQYTHIFLTGAHEPNPIIVKASARLQATAGRGVVGGPLRRGRFGIPQSRSAGRQGAGSVAATVRDRLRWLIGDRTWPIWNTGYATLNETCADGGASHGSVSS